jgi:hypothetical protein
MRTLIVFYLLTTIAIAQEGMPVNVGNGSLPAGLEGETDLNTIKQKRIEALQLAVEALRNRYRQGRDQINILLAAQTKLAIANLDYTTVKKERLAHMETALISSLSAWQYLDAREKVGAGRADEELQARAAVFKFRAMWLAENAGNSQHPANAQEEMLAKVGNGSLPPGLAGETDLNVIKQKRIEALRDAVEIVRRRYRNGTDQINILLAPQNELLLANLDSTTVKKERLAHIETALINSLSTWQDIDVQLKDGRVRADEEAQARAAVFKFWVMWLAENAGGSQQPANAQEEMLARVGSGSLPPGLAGKTDLNTIKQKRIEALRDAVGALRNRYRDGTDQINILLAAQNELMLANLDSTTVKKERLAHIETALISAISTWQNLEVRLKVGAGRTDEEVQGRAAVFNFRAMWLAENAEGRNSH